MLVLSRKLNETIQIGDQITLRVVQIRGNRVRLGIEAPAEVRVMRTELTDNSENASSANGSSSPAEFESAVIVPPWVAEAAGDELPPELQGNDADHWQTQRAPRATSRPRRQRMLMPEISSLVSSVATAK